ncbi:MAG: hypothetical protein AB8G22_00320 [Saprospiraceae bacterium]
MKKWLLLWCCFGIVGTLLAQQNYQGYRIFVTDLSVYQKKSDWLRISYIAHNTGRLSLPMDKKKNATLEVNFDPSLAQHQLAPFANQIRAAFQGERLELPVGTSSRLDYIKVNINNQDADLKTAYAAVQVSEVVKKKEVAPVAAPVVLVPKAKPKEKEIKPIEKKPTEVVAVAEDRKSQPADNEEIEDKKPQYEYNPKLESKRIKGTSFSTNTTVSDTDFEAIEREKAMCPDLILEKVKILEQSKRWLTVEYQIKNIGKGSAILMGKEAHERDNVAVKAYMSGTPKLSRGAINIGGKFVKTGKSVLAPGEINTGKIKLDISSQTRYTPVVILTLDAFQTFRECDRTNNMGHVVVK